MAQRGRPMKRVPVKEIDVSDHTMYSDGTYQNEPPVKIEPQEKPKEDSTLKGKLKVYDTLAFADGTRWQVLHLLEWGIAVAQLPRKSQAGMHNAVMYSWEDLASKEARKV